MSLLLLWTGTDAWRAEACEVDLTERGLVATGAQIGADPVGYRLEYRLETGPELETRRLYATAVGSGWRRSLDLRRSPTGEWTIAAMADGSVGAGVELLEPGGDPGVLTGALDCDLGRSPLTNLMPVRRHDLHRTPGARDFVMAWVRVPDLSVHRVPQRYEHVRRLAGGGIVRYVGEHRDFVGELVVDGAGFVISYPDLAERVPAG